MLPADAAVVADATDFEVGRIPDGRNPRRVGTRRRTIERVSSPLADRFVRTFVVVFEYEAIKPPLLRTWLVLTPTEFRLGLATNDDPNDASKRVA